MYYTKLAVRCNIGYAEMLIAELAETGFDTFLENEEGFEAFAEENFFDNDALQAIKSKYEAYAPVTFVFEKIEKKNWNEEWEKNYHPIIVDDRCLIRAEFHRVEKKYPYEIIITPKMSFGTGHHQTTWLMIKNQLDMDHNNKRVMDAGCGTAILSVMASMLGARAVEALDIDEWSVLNGKENIQINQCKNIRIRKGKISELGFKGKFDIILANINKNVLLEEIKMYASLLKPEGKMLLSGFYTDDIPDLLEEGGACALTEEKRDERESWASLLLRKNREK